MLYNYSKLSLTSPEQQYLGVRCQLFGRVLFSFNWVYNGVYILICFYRDIIIFINKCDFIACRERYKCGWIYTQLSLVLLELRPS